MLRNEGVWGDSTAGNMQEQVLKARKQCAEEFVFILYSGKPLQTRLTCLDKNCGDKAHFTQ